MKFRELGRYAGLESAITITILLPWIALSMNSGPRVNHFMMMVNELKVNLSQE